MTSPFKKMFLVQHFGSFGSNQYDHEVIVFNAHFDVFIDILFTKFLFDYIIMVILVRTKWTKMLNQKHFFKRGSHVIVQKSENVEYQGEGVVNVCYNSSYLSQLLLIYNRNKRWKPCEPNVCGSTPVQLLNIFSSKMSTGSHLIEIFLNRFEPVLIIILLYFSCFNWSFLIITGNNLSYLVISGHLWS